MEALLKRLWQEHAAETPAMPTIEFSQYRLGCLGVSYLKKRRHRNKINIIKISSNKISIIKSKQISNKFFVSQFSSSWKYYPLAETLRKLNRRHYKPRGKL
jgi:hypothetical protein